MAAANIYSALSARAYAEQCWPELGFHDRAARLLAALLGVHKPVQNDPEWERSCLVRSQWFDMRCCEFFTRHPQGLCIDLGAGLSTRFHRLSEADDWPRFSWVDVDVPEVIALKQNAIPRIDNYQLIAADIASDDWLAATGWHPHTPLIITLESVLPDMSLTEIGKVFAIIAKHCVATRCARASQIEILFDYAKPARRWYEFFFSCPRARALQYLTHCLALLDLIPIPDNSTDSLCKNSSSRGLFVYSTLSTIG